MFTRILLLFALAGWGTALGDSYKMFESNVVSQIGQYMTLYKTMHGEYPTKWDDISAMLTAPIDTLYSYVQPTKRYAFVTGSVPMEYPERGRLLLVTRSPFRETTYIQMWWGGTLKGLRQPGRYVLFELPTGELLDIYVDEAYVQKIFGDAKVPLPAPDPLGLRPQEMTDWSQLGPWIIGLLLAVPFVGLWLQRRQFRKRIA